MDRSSNGLQHLNRFLDASVKAQSSPSDRESLGEKQVECEKHGAYTSSGVRYLGRREIWTRCPDCDAEEVSARLKAEADAEARRQQERLERLIQQAAIPARFIGRSFDNFNAATPSQSHALGILRDYAAQFESNYDKGRGLILSGLPGTGKSHLASAVLQSILPDYCGQYLTCLGLIRMVRSTWRRDSDRSESEVMDVLASVPLLVIDEIGVQYGTDGEQTILFEVLDARYRSMAPTILLTNQNKEGLKAFLGERTYDRLTETCKWVAFDWESYRPTARKEAA